MELASSDGEFAKVLVESDQDASLARGAFEDLLVAQIPFPAAGPRDIVAGLLQNGRRAAPDAGVEEDLHAAVSEMGGSTRSCPTTLRA